MTYPMSAEGIEWEVLQDCITSFLGPEAFASLERTQVLFNSTMAISSPSSTHPGLTSIKDGEDVYWVTATRPFLPASFPRSFIHLILSKPIPYK